MRLHAPRVRASIHESPQAWRERWFALFPRAWVPELRAQSAALDARGDEFTANRLVLDVGESFAADVLHGDADDAKLCEAATARADECMRMAGRLHDMPALRSMLDGIADRWRVGRATGDTDTAAVLRYVDEYWWRRALRRSHGRAIEGAAIRLGRVNKRRDCYVSAEAVARRAAQNARNAAAMESTVMENESGKRFTVADLAARSVSNKPIRRAELMVRLAGFDAAARVRGDGGEFITLTCPSRFHPWTTAGGLTRNPKYDPALTPREGQAWLRSVWARIRAALARIELHVYGFRIAEPQHDGTPHWHLILFYPEGRRADLIATIRRYALADDGTEAGAQRYRVKCVAIDPAKGSAVAYVAKYIAKNIDGIGLDTDLFGNPILSTTARVEAWASTWGIRQFQQIGGPPVGLWRECRRIKLDAIADGPDYLRDAWHAAQAVRDDGGGVVEGASFFRFMAALGGPVCRRRDRPVWMLREWSDDLTKYGEVVGNRPVGIATRDRFKDFGGIVGRIFAPRVSGAFFSTRHRWRVVSVAGAGAKRPTSRPWTGANNCTRHGGAHVEPAATAAVDEGIEEWISEFEAAESSGNDGSGMLRWSRADGSSASSSARFRPG